jgi:hypothetical protein
MPTSHSRSTRWRRERAYRRRLAAGLVISALVHLAVLLATGRFLPEPPPFFRPSLETEPAPRGLVVVEVPDTPAEPEPETPRPEPEELRPRRPEETEVVQIVPTPLPEAEGEPATDEPRETEAAEPPGRLTNAERLRPRFSDARLWVDPRDPLLFGERLERFARADSAVRAILREWLDSLRLTEEQRRRALDWTYEKDGKRWGVSPEGIHLGDITIPIPFQLMPSGPQRREFEQALRDLQEIQSQDIRDDIERVRRERREEMRRRSEEEAERRRQRDTTFVRSPKN